MVCAAAVHTASFSPVLKRTRTSVNGAASRRRDDDDDLYRDALALNKARTDIRNFLTQRAIQSFVGLLIHCRDEATVRWLEVSGYSIGAYRMQLTSECISKSSLDALSHTEKVRISEPR
jgi:hypothetical protein